MKNKIIEGLGLFAISLIGTIILLIIGNQTGKDINEPLSLLICCDILFGLCTLILFIKHKS